MIPEAADRQLEVLSGEDANSSFGFKYEMPNVGQPEENGHRIMISLRTAKERNHFLTVFQLTAGDTDPLPINYYETPVSDVVLLADRIDSSNSTNFIDKGFPIKVPDDTNYQVVLAGMKSGKWNVKSTDGKINMNTHTEEGKIPYFSGLRAANMQSAPTGLTGLT